jgi:hypothetical protein
MEGEERLAHADDADLPAFDVDDAATVASHVLDRPDAVLHLTSSNWRRRVGFPVTNRFAKHGSDASRGRAPRP